MPNRFWVNLWRQLKAFLKLSGLVKDVVWDESLRYIFQQVGSGKRISYGNKEIWCFYGTGQHLRLSILQPVNDVVFWSLFGLLFGLVRLKQLDNIEFVCGLLAKRKDFALSIISTRCHKRHTFDSKNFGKFILTYLASIYFSLKS